MVLWLVFILTKQKNKSNITLIQTHLDSKYLSGKISF